VKPTIVPSKKFQRWLDALDTASLPTSEGLFDKVATDMARLGDEIDWDELKVQAAEPNEECLYLLAQHESDGPALYLVSDGAGVTSPAHEHKTWAVIVGLSGIESNILYELNSLNGREVRRGEVKNIGAGDSIVLTDGAIHATEVIGPQATFHLHLYGKPLHCLPSFEDRIFCVLA